MKEVEGLVEALNDAAAKPYDMRDTQGRADLMALAAAALAEAQSSRDGYIAQHQADSSELRRLCAARDEAIAAKLAAESELAALREKIANAQVVEVTLGCYITEQVRPELALQRVALVPIDTDGGGGEAA